MDSQIQLIRLFIRLPNGNGCHFDISHDFTLKKLIQRLRSSHFQLPSKYRLLHQGKHLTDESKSLSDLGIQSDSILHVQPAEQKRSQEWKVNVAFLFEGEKFIISHSVKQSIWSLKLEIQKLIGIEPDEQMLVFLGKKLKNKRTLKHYKIVSDSLLSLLVEMESKGKGHSQGKLASSLFTFSEKKTGLTMSTLFRSDSINKKNVEEVAPVQVTIKKRVSENQRNSSQIYQILQRENSLKESLTFQICEKVKEPTVLVKPSKLEEKVKTEGKEQFFDDKGHPEKTL